VKAGKIGHRKIGRNIVFNPDELKAFKMAKVKN
jgi:hypothetical protein